MGWLRHACLTLVGAAAAGSAVVPAQSTNDQQVASSLQRIGAFVERYYARARNVVADARVRVQPMRRDLSPDGRARHLLYEMRVEWEEKTAEPVIVRDLVEADGRVRTQGDDLECTDPELVSVDPLAMFLPAWRRDFSFSWAGRDDEAGRNAIVLDYRARSEEPPTIEWDGPCVSVDLPAMKAGKVWADPASGEVLRVDERLTGMFEFRVPPDQNRAGGPLRMVIERADTSVRYRPVEFSDPDETLLLPSSIELMTVWRNAASQRLFITHDISNYRRFVTRARIVGDSGPP